MRGQRGGRLAGGQRALALAYYSGWREFYTFSFTRDAEASTFWYMGHYLATVGFNGGYAPAWAPSGVAVAFLLLGALAARRLAGPAGAGQAAARAAGVPRRCSPSC